MSARTRYVVEHRKGGAWVPGQVAHLMRNGRTLCKTENMARQWAYRLTLTLDPKWRTCKVCARFART